MSQDNCGLGTALAKLKENLTRVACLLTLSPCQERPRLPLPAFRDWRVSPASAHLLPALAGPGTLELRRERGSLSFLPLASFVARTLL